MAEKSKRRNTKSNGKRNCVSAAGFLLRMMFLGVWRFRFVNLLNLIGDSSFINRDSWFLIKYQNAIVNQINFWIF